MDCGKKILIKNKGLINEYNLLISLMNSYNIDDEIEKNEWNNWCYGRYISRDSIIVLPVNNKFNNENAIKKNFDEYGFITRINLWDDESAHIMFDKQYYADALCDKIKNINVYFNGQKSIMNAKYHFRKPCIKFMDPQQRCPMQCKKFHGPYNKIDFIPLNVYHSDELRNKWIQKRQKKVINVIKKRYKIFMRKYKIKNILPPNINTYESNNNDNNNELKNETNFNDNDTNNIYSNNNNNNSSNIGNSNNNKNRIKLSLNKMGPTNKKMVQNANLELHMKKVRKIRPYQPYPPIKPPPLPPNNRINIFNLDDIKISFHEIQKMNSNINPNRMYIGNHTNSYGHFSWNNNHFINDKSKLLYNNYLLSHEYILNEKNQQLNKTKCIKYLLNINKYKSINEYPYLNSIKEQQLQLLLCKIQDNQPHIPIPDIPLQNTNHDDIITSPNHNNEFHYNSNTNLDDIIPNNELFNDIFHDTTHPSTPVNNNHTTIITNNNSNESLIDTIDNISASKSPKNTVYTRDSLWKKIEKIKDEYGLNNNGEMPDWQKVRKALKTQIDSNIWLTIKQNKTIKKVKARYRKLIEIPHGLYTNKE